jgi:hypothetical protein
VTEVVGVFVPLFVRRFISNSFDFLGQFAIWLAFLCLQEPCKAIPLITVASIPM